MFEFYFIEEMQGSLGPGWFSKLLPFITLLLGVALGRWFQFYDKRRRDKKAAHDLITEIQLLDEPVAKQVKIVDDLIETLKARHLITPKYTSILSLKLDRLTVLDRTGVVDYFERVMETRKVALEKANELFLGCEVFTHQHSQLHVIIDEHMERSSRMFEDWREKSNKLLRMIARMMADVEAKEIDPATDPFIAGAIGLTKDLTRTENVFKILDDVHTPLTEHNAKYRTDPRAQEIAELNSQALQVLTALEREKEYTVAKLGATKHSMMRQYEKFKELLATLKFVKK